MTSPLTLSFGSDHGGLALRRGLSEALKAKGYVILDRGTETEASCDYPDYAQAVGADVVAGRAKGFQDGTRPQRPTPLQVRLGKQAVRSAVGRGHLHRFSRPRQRTIDLLQLQERPAGCDSGRQGGRCFRAPGSHQPEHAHGITPDREGLDGTLAATFDVEGQQPWRGGGHAAVA